MSLRKILVAGAVVASFAIAPATAATECHDLGGEGTLCVTTPDDPAAGGGVGVGLHLNAGVNVCLVVLESCP